MNDTMKIDIRYLRAFLLALVAVMIFAFYSLNFAHRSATQVIPDTKTMQWSSDTSWTGGWR